MIIQNDAQRAEEIRADIEANKSKLKTGLFKFGVYLTSTNVTDDDTCNSSYEGGINALELVSTEVERTAGFIDAINGALVIADANAVNKIMSKVPIY
jgi:hypothetical protein